MSPIPPLPFPQEMIYCFCWTIFYFIAGSVFALTYSFFLAPSFYPFPYFPLRLAVASVSHPRAAGWAVAAVGNFGSIFDQLWGKMVGEEEDAISG